MYSIDDRDRVRLLDHLPGASAGAAEPVILARGGDLRLAYRLAAEAEGSAVLLEARRPRAHYFGPPNDEALAGHPLHARGLTYYATAEVLDSSWIRELERRNRVHARYDPASYAALRHFVLAFDEAVFE